jgi:hypothetical protein
MWKCGILGGMVDTGATFFLAARSVTLRDRCAIALCRLH